jgi:hypothetical protein
MIVLRVRAEPGVDAIKALGAWLKIGLRTFGIKCLGITPREMEANMDMRGFSSPFIKVDHVRDGPIQTRIVNVFKSGRFGRPVLELETGSQFTLNVTNNDTLVKAWGYDSDDWVGQEIELLLGTYKDWESDPVVDKETVKVRAISPAKSAAADGGAPAASKPLPPSRTATAGGRDVMDDDIPSDGGEG